ncbi:Uncharacterized protein PCOAH_00006400 [Plasmodium coatneyi]|uniref:Tryptophan/threonine-rich plasmodium antigen C-terminal domain-containing protein n=1 Tax=Plasmodium coatneyi TaxID=208452 RepID=A0A1B1DUL4_9APIC|nr:Uncharacterized protein PCOAH_00006400 [Plasmodium coatneyi]ANQ06486.1 Uncharacterized protein PCOAH_00006400 [Plasmodium coatneyi]
MCTLSKMKIILLLLYIPSMVIILSSASETMPALSGYFKKYKTKTKGKSCAESTTLHAQEFMDMQEEWKEDQWDDFMKETEEDWEKFKTTMDSLITSWFKKKHMEWEAWLKAMKNRWAYFNKNMDEAVLNVIKNTLKWTDYQWQKWIILMKSKSMEPVETSGDEYILDVFRLNTSWTTAQWKEWIQTLMRESMEKDWEYWVEEDQYKLDNWMMENFDKWKNRRMKVWKGKQWKTEETEYWTNWEDNKSKRKSKKQNERANWSLWKERTEREQNEWDTYTEMKKEEFFNKDVEQWIKWKSERTEMFHEWKENLLAKWIKEKEWHVWTYKRKDVFRRKLY